MTDFRMPSLGADMAAGTVVEWRVAPGAVVKRGEIIGEVETEKGVFEVESPAEGIVRELLVSVGSKVPVGTVLAHIDANGGPPAVSAPAVAAPSPPTAAPPASAATAATPPAPPAAPSVPTPAPPASPPPTPPETSVLAERPHPHASPLARRIAAERGIDLTTVVGTGAGGAITRADVERTAASPFPAAAPMTAAAPPAPAAPTAPSSPAGPTEDVRRAMRRAVAAAVARSKREIPHYYLAADIDLWAATEWLRTENLRRPVGERLLPAALLLKAVGRALRAFPDLNGFWVNDAAQRSDAIHLGVAISLRGGGLIAPAIHDADTRSLPELMAALLDLVQRARTGGLRGSEMTDGTITVTNLGDEGATTVFGVIYPPQLAIVGFGGITPRPRAIDGLLGVRPMVTVTLAADHRATDGHYGSRFLGEVDRLLQHPEAL